MEAFPSPSPAVLLVDDVDANLVALDAVLAPLHVDVLRAGSGPEALALLAREADRIALTLLDVQMPAMDGFEVAERMRGDRRLAGIPIIFLTAHDADRSEAMRGYASGGVDYIAKPFDADEFREKVRAMLEIDAERRLMRERIDQELRVERQRSSRMLRRLERVGAREYHRLANALPAIVWTADREGTVDFCSDRFTEQLHVDAQVLRATGWEGIVHPDDLERWLESRAQARASGSAHWIECRLGSIVDGYRLFQLRELPRTDDRGRITGWVGSGLDIEVQHDAVANKLLAEAGQVLRDTGDWRASLATVPRLMVPAFADRVQVELAPPHDEVGGVTIGGSAAGDHVPAAAARLLDVDHVRASGTARFLPLVEAADEVGFHSAIVVPIQARGEVYGTLTLLAEQRSRRFDLQDLELATRLADQLGATVRDGILYDQARAGADAALVLDAVADGVALIDAGGTVRVWNAAAERITGLAARDLVGRGAASAIPWWRDLEPRIPMGTDDEPVAARTLQASGRESDLWLSISGVDFGRGRAFAFRDATRLHRLERLQSDFIATVSHELRTPLASITGACETLMRRDITLDEPTRTRLFNVMSTQSRRLTELVDDVLVAGRIGASRVHADLQPVDAAEVARRVIDAAALRTPAGTELVLEAGEHLPRVEADPALLQQVLTNLVDNAIKYSPEGGRIAVRLSARVRSMRIEVADEGIGIAEEDQPDIFAKFFRVDADVSRGVGGSGLGLYIVRELVERMRGRIQVRSRLGTGTTFELDLPLAESALDAQGGSPESITHGGDASAS